VKERVYWPVYWPETEVDTEHLCFFDDKAMAEGLCVFLKGIGCNAHVHPPVHLSTFDTFLTGSA
jgi:hypothetical protein